MTGKLGLGSVLLRPEIGFMCLCLNLLVSWLQES